MQADGVIAHYAIGGGVAAIYYLEPAATLDVDVFVILPFAAGDSPHDVGPLYEYLRARGGTLQGEHIVIGNWPVRFLVPANELERDAVVGSVPVAVEDVRTWIMLSEHLVAIALHAGRPKDHLRILQFI